MSVNAKSASSMLVLKSSISLLYPKATLTDYQDALGAGLLVNFGGNESLAIRIISDSTPFVNSIGSAQAVFSPMILQCVEESGILSFAHSANLQKLVTDMHMITQRWVNASGTHVALSQFAADGTVSSSTLSATIYPDVRWPLSGQ